MFWIFSIRVDRGTSASLVDQRRGNVTVAMAGAQMDYLQDDRLEAVLGEEFTAFLSNKQGRGGSVENSISYF